MSKKRTWIVAAVAAVVFAIPAMVIATDTFTDVADDHTFHNDITWLGDTGVTKGCNPPANTNYCPDDPLTRGQMAAMLHRLSTNQIVDAATVGGHTPEDLKGSTETLILFETDAVETHTDVNGDAAFSAGDFILEQATLINTDTSNQVGSAVEELRIVEVTQPPTGNNPGDWEFIMDATFALNDGNITWGGYATIPDFLAGKAILPIRGGTGDYTGATGTATLSVGEHNGEVGTHITLNITR